MDENENQNTNPFDLFVTECNDVDAEVRINSIKKLPTVAVALDTERTRAELIPYLDTLTEGFYNDDEVLLNLAEQLGNFLPFVGGTDNAKLILNVLEKLAAVEENVVREKALESLHKVVCALDAAGVETVFIPLLLRLVDSGWFTSKSSACALFASCYLKVSEEVKADLRTAYRVLCQDESPLVRRSAASKLTEFAAVLELHHLKDEFIPVFDNFSKDDQDSVRVLAVDVGISIAQRLKAKEVEDFILTTLSELCGDASWRVRYQVAYQINAMQLALGHELTRKYLVAIFDNLVHDTEPQVREVAAKGIVRFCEVLQRTFKEAGGGDTLDPVILTQVFPLMQYLDQDVNLEVKEALSTVITSLSPLLGVENTKNLLLPLITNSLLNDSSKVRENIISNLNDIISVIGITDIADTVLQIIVDLVNSSASVWRTRRNLIVTINYMAKHSGKEYFDAHLRSLYQKLLSDGVYAVRKTAPLILPILAKNFGVAWAAASVVPELLAFAEHRHYLYRFVCLFCIDEFVLPTLEARRKDATTGNGENRPQLLRRLQPATGQEQIRNSSSFILFKVRRLTRNLQAKLQEQWVVDVLRVLEENDVLDDDIKKYAEDTIEMFIRDNNLDISSVSEEEIESPAGDVYLEGVLALAADKFLAVLRKLAADPVPNIQLKVAKTLQKIGEFSRSLQAELNQEWVHLVLRGYEDDSEITEDTPTPATKSAEIEDCSKQDEKQEVDIIRKAEGVSISEESSNEEPLQSEEEQNATSEDELQQTATVGEDRSAEPEEGTGVPSDPEKSMETEFIEILEQKLSSEKNTPSAQS